MAAELIRGEAMGQCVDAEAVGRRLGADLLARGAKGILDAVYG